MPKLLKPLINVAIIACLLGIVGTRSTTGQEASAGAVGRKIRTKTSPDYPALAKQLNLTGRVKLQITIAADGHVVTTQPLGGSPLLVDAATEAVKKWVYEPGSKETTEVVEFYFSPKR
jgi:TonB family protein